MPDQLWPDQVFQILGFVEGPTPTQPRRNRPQSDADRHRVFLLFLQNFDGVTPPALPPGWSRERHRPGWHNVANVGFRVAIASC